MDIITFIIIGLIAGWLASIIMRGHGLGVLGDIAVGVVGAIIGGYVFSVMDIYPGGFISQVLMASLGAVILLFLISFVRRPTV